jgi:glycosyltransferase involved in cell wall biosynthesis
VYCDSVSSPRGALERRESDSSTFSIQVVSLPSAFAKYSPLKRLAQERAYGRELVRVARTFGPDVVISGNTPLLSQRAILSWCRYAGVPFTFWAQDLLGVGVRSVLARRSRVLAATAGRAFASLEARILRRSSAIVAIADEFVPSIISAGVPADRIHVIENWAPIEELPLVGRDNAWAEEHGLTGRVVFLYSGTLGLKHDPERLLELAAEVPDALVVVVSEGPAVDRLVTEARGRHLDNVRVFGFQPYSALPSVLASADVLVALLESDAGVFSVPSKVLTYHAAGRAILASIPAENLSAAVLRRSRAGIVVDAGDREAFLEAGRALAGVPELRERFAAAGRRYAEATFRIEDVADRFETVLTSTVVDRVASPLPRPSRVEVTT